MKQKQKNNAKILIWAGASLFVLLIAFVVIAKTLSAQGMGEVFRYAPGDPDPFSTNSMLSKNIPIIPSKTVYQQEEDDYLVYVYSDDCSACKKFKSIIYDYQELPGAIKIYALNEAATENQSFLKENGIQGTPTLMRVRDNEETWRSLGALPLENLPLRNQKG